MFHKLLVVILGLLLIFVFLPSITLAACDPGWVPCGSGHCMPAGATCMRDGSYCPAGRDYFPPSDCCAKGWWPCPDGSGCVPAGATCMRSNSYCVAGRTYISTTDTCCAEGEGRCGDKCMPAGATCTNDTICLAGSTYYPDKNICCPQGSVPFGGGCLPAGASICGVGWCRPGYRCDTASGVSKCVTDEEACVCCDPTYKSCAARCPAETPVWKDDGSNGGLGSCWPVGKCPLSGGMCYPCSANRVSCPR